MRRSAMRSSPAFHTASGFIKNRYVGRTFILPTQKERERAVHIKLNVLKAAVAGKRVVLVDDSIVRGTTTTQITHMLREAGATEVHIRISSPPFINPCYFGTDIDSKDKLIACRMSLEEIRKTLDADSLGYLSLEHLQQIAQVTTGWRFLHGMLHRRVPDRGPGRDSVRQIFSEALQQLNSTESEQERILNL